MMNNSGHDIFFTKMQAAGNDFVVIDNRSKTYTKDQLIALAPDICDRRFGVGSDGILALFPSERKEVDYTMFYRNPDGSDAGMCGNGARCMALFAQSLGFADKHTFNVHDNIYEAHILAEDTVSVAFPMEASVEELTLDDEQLYAIHTGTQHLVLPVEKQELEEEKTLVQQGRHLRYHKHFAPKGTNVNFIYGAHDTALHLQTYERGVEDLTLACGTGAIASALVWHHLQNNTSTAGKYSVDTKGGTLNVHFAFDVNNKTYRNIKLEGPAHFVFKGSYLQ
ncbi:diaminopimelate epimerase [Fodinibius sp. Rm-B-1B1-1]|uniref:diaminopimelate epimerase n=1 Tax=Fodinibius alkaliphilus TaxID=3140241 RepID=UPI003159F0F9